MLSDYLGLLYQSHYDENKFKRPISVSCRPLSSSSAKTAFSVGTMWLLMCLLRTENHIFHHCWDKRRSVRPVTVWSKGVNATSERPFRETLRLSTCQSGTLARYCSLSGLPCLYKHNWFIVKLIQSNAVWRAHGSFRMCDCLPPSALIVWGEFILQTLTISARTPLPALKWLFRLCHFFLRGAREMKNVLGTLIWQLCLL